MKPADTAELPDMAHGPCVAMRRRNFPGESVCGDAMGFWRGEERRVFCIADGLGHGPEAAVAAESAVAYVGAHLEEDIVTMLAGCDAALRTSRGAAAGIVCIEAGRLSYGGVGNTRAALVGARSCRFSSDPGIVGAGFSRIHVEVTPIEHSDLVMLFTDGLSERLRVPASATLGRVDTHALATALLDAWWTGRDDSAILVYQHTDSR